MLVWKAMLSITWMMSAILRELVVDALHGFHDLRHHIAALGRHRTGAVGEVFAWRAFRRSAEP